MAWHSSSVPNSPCSRGMAREREQLVRVRAGPGLGGGPPDGHGDLGEHGPPGGGRSGGGDFARQVPAGCAGDEDGGGLPGSRRRAGRASCAAARPGRRPIRPCQRATAGGEPARAIRGLAGARHPRIRLRRRGIRGPADRQAPASGVAASSDQPRPAAIQRHRAPQSAEPARQLPARPAGRRAQSRSSRCRAAATTGNAARPRRGRAGRVRMATWRARAASSRPSMTTLSVTGRAWFAVPGTGRTCLWPPPALMLTLSAP